MSALRRVASQAAGPVGLIGTVGGFVADVLAPLGAFAPWVAGFSFLVAGAALFLFVQTQRRQGDAVWESNLPGVLFISATSAVIFTIWSIIFAAGPERGYLAENVEPIAQLQAQLLNLEQDVAEIKETTSASATQIVVAATAQAEGFAEIQASFAALQANQALVTDPKTPQEWYSNARLYQLKGDTANAIQAYEGYFAFDLEYVDPYLDYVALLKATEGIARTRQIIGDRLAASPESLTLDLVAATLLDAPEERLARLKALASRAPQYGPVFYELGQEYTRALANTVTSQEVEALIESYNTLIDLEAQQLFSRYYIDKALATKRVEEARASIDGFADASQALGNIDMQVFYYPNGVQIIVVLPELYSTQQLLFSFDDPEPKTDAGRMASGAQSFVNSAIGPVPLTPGEHTFYMQYIDANGVPSEVYSKGLTVEPIAINFQQLPKDFSTNAIPGIFTLGILGAQGFEPHTFRYSLDDDSLGESYEGVAFGSISIPSLTPGEHTLYIQATAADGTQTKVVEFPFTVQ